MSRSRSDAGFTLVELLVSMALLSMAAVLTAQGFATQRGDLLRIQAHTEAGEDVAAAQDLIRARIQHLFPRTAYDNVGASVDMDGEPASLEFRAATPQSPDAGLASPMRRYRLQLNPKGELLLIALGDESPSNDAPMVLLRGVSSVEFGYFGPVTAGVGAWRADWKRMSAPPELVRLRLGFTAGDRRVWPELIVRPAVTVDRACVLDADTGQCRGRA
jgi:general secretion pathway protein J